MKSHLRVTHFTFYFRLEQLHKVGTNEDVWKRIAMASDNTGKTPLIFNRQSVVFCNDVFVVQHTLPS